MSVRKLDDSRWQVDYYPQGRKGARVRVNVAGSQADAVALELELRRSHSLGSLRVVNPKVGDLYPEFLAHAKLHNAPRYHETLKYAFVAIRKFFGMTQVTRILPSTIDAYKSARKIDGVSGKTVNNELVYLNRLINFAAERNYCNPLPFKMQKYKYSRPIPKIPSPEEVGLLLNEIKDPLKKALVLILYQGGARWREAAHLKWESVDWRNKSAILVETKGGRARPLYLTDAVIKLLRPYKKPEGWIFENPRTGRPYGTFKTIFRLAQKRLEKNKTPIGRIHPHLLRHAFGTNSLAATGDIRTVQRLLGHRDVATTQFYAQVFDPRLKEAVKMTSDYTRQRKRR